MLPPILAGMDGVFVGRSFTEFESILRIHEVKNRAIILELAKYINQLEVEVVDKKRKSEQKRQERAAKSKGISVGK